MFVFCSRLCRCVLVHVRMFRYAYKVQTDLIGMGKAEHPRALVSGAPVESLASKLMRCISSGSASNKRVCVYFCNDNLQSLAINKYLLITVSINIYKGNRQMFVR